MTKKIYVVTDLGPGDGGKGGVVHAVADRVAAHTIIKRGGAQGSHGVRTSRGEHFTFSHWGCATFEGVPTHLTRQMVVMPEALLNEAEALRYTAGVHDPFSLLTVDEDALLATPFDGIASCLRELSLGDNPRGTIGTGVGVAYRAYRNSPELALFARDLSRPDLRERLATIRDRVRVEVSPLLEGNFLRTDHTEVAKWQSLLDDDGFFEDVVTRFETAAAHLRVVEGSYMRDHILAQPGNAVVETSHGVLTDRLAGFHPHTSAIRTLPCFTERMLRDEDGFDGDIVNIGVTRAYAVRHGAGPMPTHDSASGERLLPGSSKDENRYQGKIRVGPMDLVLLRYALAHAGGAEAFDGLAITWFDQVQANGTWQVSNSYGRELNQAHFSPNGDIKVRMEDEADQLKLQAQLCDALWNVEPTTTSYELDPKASRDSLFELVDTVLQGSLSVPVRMVSFGPTEQDKLLK